MKKECKIVQDLLPNYIEKVTNSETNEFIGEHLKGCQECNNIYNSMKENLKVEQLDTSGEINYMRKFKNKLKILKLIIFLILIITIFVIGRRTIIMTLLNSKGEKLKETMDNYYAEVIETYPDKRITTEIKTYYKDGNYLTRRKSYQENELTMDIIIYYKDGEMIGLVEYNDGKKQRFKNVVGSRAAPLIDTRTFFLNLRESFKCRVEKLNVNSKECYLIKYAWGQDTIIDKETGFVVKDIYYKNNVVRDYYIEPGIVKDEDIQRPDTTGYVLVD